MSANNLYEKNDNSKMRYALTVFAGALLMGILWRVRGEHGWGSLWGLLCVGFIFCMFVFVICNGAKRHTLALLGSAAVAFMFTSPSWGTLNDQITGILLSDDIPIELCYINPLSGVLLMLFMGFGLASLFSFFFGIMFSGKKYKLYHIAIIIGVLLAVKYISDAFISPFVLKIIQPQAETAFAYGLSEAGIGLSPFKVHLSHLFDASWAKKILGGRNYFASTIAISTAISSLVMALTVRFAFRDKATSKIMLNVCSIFAFSITVADLIFFFANGGYRMQNVDYSSPFCTNAWSLWEYFTGFIAGLLLTVYVLSLRKKYADNFSTAPLGFFENRPKIAQIYSFITVALLSFVVSNARAAILRFDESEPRYLYIAIAASAIVFLIYIALLIKNRKKITAYSYCRFTVPFAITVCTVIYMFVGSHECLNITSLKTDYASVLVAVSWVLFMVIYGLLFLRKGAESNPDGFGQ